MNMRQKIGMTLLALAPLALFGAEQRGIYEHRA